MIVTFHLTELGEREGGVLAVESQPGDVHELVVTTRAGRLTMGQAIELGYIRAEETDDDGR